MVARFQEFFGGTFFVLEKRKQHFKHTFRWKIVGERAWKPLKLMIPYMCQRRREKFYGLVKPTGYGSEDWGSHLQKQTTRGEIEYQTLIKTDQQQSWKDEFVLLLVSAPVLLLIWSVFSDDPDIKTKIDLFFEYFKNMPMWFQILFISVVGAVYGIKGTEIMRKK
jgi:hypothetical protein